MIESILYTSHDKATNLFMEEKNMTNESTRWNSRTAFIFAAAAAAVGLGNIWRFPYLAGQNGGGAFVLLYLFFVIALGLPLMTSEVMLGRIGRKNPVGSFVKLAKNNNHSRLWGLVGGLSIVAGFLILSYYIVITGWVFDYFIRALAGQFRYATEISAAHDFQSLQDSAWQMLLSDTLVALSAITVISLGIKRGLERAVMILFPALAIILLILLIYAISAADFKQGLSFLFNPNFHQITGKVVLMALGQAFFSLNIGMGIIIMFSAYLPDDVPLISSTVAVVFADTIIAIVSGLIIFPIVFANHLQPAAGPSLIFRTLPIAFTNLPFGSFFGALFFLLLLFAAFTSVIALLEVMVAWLEENHNFKRHSAVYLSGIIIWVLSLGTVFSFSHRLHFSYHGVSFFQAIDFVTSAIMLPLGGFFIAIFTGWLLPKKYIHDKLGWNIKSGWFYCWRWIERYFAPIAIALILLKSIGIF